MAPPNPGDRRATPRRRARDRIATGTVSGALLGRDDLADQLLLLEDDLRETALALGGIESYVLRATELLQSPGLGRDELATLAGEGQVIERIDALSDNLVALRRRLTQLAAALKQGD